MANSSNARAMDGAVVGRLRDRGVDEARGPVRQALGGVGARHHLAELVLDGAERGDRLAELLASGRVLRRVADRAAAAAGAHRAQAEAAVVERVERHLVAAADLAEHVPGRHAHVLQQDRRGGRAVQPHLVLFLARAEAAERALDDERGELLAVDLGEDDEDVGEAAVRDPHLLARERPAAVRLLRGPGLGGERVGSGAGLAERVGADDLAAERGAAGTAPSAPRCRRGRWAARSGWPGRRRWWQTKPNARCARPPPATTPCRGPGRRTVRARSGPAGPARRTCAAARATAPSPWPRGAAARA